MAPGAQGEKTGQISTVQRFFCLLDARIQAVKKEKTFTEHH